MSEPRRKLSFLDRGVAQVALGEAEAAGYRVTMHGGGFGPDGDGHYAYLDTEDGLGTTIELIQRPKRRAAPEKIYPPPAD